MRYQPVHKSQSLKRIKSLLYPQLVIDSVCLGQLSLGFGTHFVTAQRPWNNGEGPSHSCQPQKLHLSFSIATGNISPET